jgi:photosystem II stability/assembly factor-like uncharacterized protein
MGVLLPPWYPDLGDNHRRETMANASRGRRRPLLTPVLVVFGLVVLLTCSCEDNECTVCPPEDSTPTGWYVQDLPTQESLNNVRVLGSRTVIAAGAAGAIVRTTDGGDTWSPVNSGTVEALQGFFFSDAATGWAVGYNGAVIKTADGGVTWTPVAVPLVTNFRDAFFVDENTGWVVGGPTGSETVDPVIMKTINGGASWDTETPTFTPRTMFFVDADSGCVAGGADLLRTTDGGVTWTPYDAAPRSWFGCLFFVGSLRGWATGGQGYIATTEDGGKTWTPQNSGTDRNISEIYFVDANTGWYVARNPGTIGATTDGGATWKFQTYPSDLNPTDVTFFDADTGWICGADGLMLKTVTGGW